MNKRTTRMKKTSLDVAKAKRGTKRERNAI
jgi:hypothetical protein